MSNLFMQRYQELIASTAPNWIKRGAYRYLLRYLPLDCNDLQGTQTLLKQVGIVASEEQVRDFLRDLSVGIEHIDAILIRMMLADAWMGEDEIWRK